MNSYIKRVSDVQIEQALKVSGAVVIEGARAVGKTESARRFANSELRLDSNDPLAILAREQPALALQGAVPRLLDEWQLVPEIWNEVRHEVDKRRIEGQFLLSGSAALDENPLRHSGAGRFLRLKMRTMSFLETGHSTGQISVKKLLDGNFSDFLTIRQPEINFQDVVKRMVIGGWPGWLHLEEKAAMKRASAYLADTVEKDLLTVSGKSRDPRRFMAFLRAIAALVAQPSTLAAIQRHIATEEYVSASEKVIPDLVDFATRMFVVENQPAWSPKLRSRATPVQMPKRHLVDVSLVASLIEAGSERLMIEREMLGHIFESQVFHDLQIYTGELDIRGVFHFRDTKGRDEIDIVVEAGNGDWVGIEVKLGRGSIDQAAGNLKRVAAKIDREPKALLVVTPTDIAHVRSDGVLVAPIVSLGP